MAKKTNRVQATNCHNLFGALSGIQVGEISLGSELRSLGPVHLTRKCFTLRELQLNAIFSIEFRLVVLLKRSLVTSEKAIGLGWIPSSSQQFVCPKWLFGPLICGQKTYKKRGGKAGWDALEKQK